MVVHSSKLTCPVRVNLNRNKDSQAIEGLCTMVAHEGKDVGYGHWKCAGNLKECMGDFTFTGGLVDSRVCQEPPLSRPVSSLNCRKGKTVKLLDMRCGRT